ncbi:MAG: lipoate--protein ligase family protein [Chloroflexota bacterium]|nr:MAG: lipoate--protein ligase family protein [Chloroflexota bacterium]
MTTARVLPIGRASAPMLMATDETLLRTCQERGQPSLHVYTWSGAWLSIGISRSLNDIDRGRASVDRVRIARRHSGGAAVLHRWQIGWSLVVPTDHALGCLDIVESYRRHAEYTVGALSRLGIQARAATVAEARASVTDGAIERVCFGSLAPHEIVAGDPPRKLVGWGQIRRRSAVLHHAVIHRRRPEFVARYIRGSSPALDEEIAQRVIGSEELASGVTAPGLRHALVAALAEFGLDFANQPLTPDESNSIHQLLSSKYRADEWTARR